jgi:AcrR family transcriptional regulator
MSDFHTTTTRDRLVGALKRLARRKPITQVTFSDVATEAGVSPQTAIRHLKSKAHMASLVGQVDALPVDTRSRLLSSAAQVMAEKGYAGATLDEIATRAGLTKGAIYWSYASKTELFLDLVDHRASADWSRVMGFVDSSLKEVRPAHALRRLIVLVLRQLAADSEWPRLYLEFLAQAREPAVLARLKRYQADGLGSIASIVSRLQQAGAIRPHRDPRRLALLIAAFFDGLVVGSLLGEGAVAVDPIAEELAGLLEG